MREKIARAIDPGAGWDERVKTRDAGRDIYGRKQVKLMEGPTLTGPISQAYIKADAVLAAMREPSEGMCEAYTKLHAPPRYVNSKEAWQAMIDAAKAP